MALQCAAGDQYWGVQTHAGSVAKPWLRCHVKFRAMNS